MGRFDRIGISDGLTGEKKASRGPRLKTGRMEQGRGGSRAAMDALVCRLERRIASLRQVYDAAVGLVISNG